MSGLLRLWRGVRGGVSTVVLALVFFGFLTPVGWVLRWLRSDPLQRRLEPDRDSYWQARRPDEDVGLLDFFGARDKLWLLPIVVVLVTVGLLLVISEGSLVLTFLYPLF
ncbi:MAG: hypothetical protein KC912_21185 [Proteobacteria bacterium]|nr:hypothetical protein [Pseudomonadota bacterium]